MLGPVLTGRRIRLAPPPPNFAEIALPWLCDPEVNRFVGLLPLTLDQEREWLDATVKSPTIVFWVIWVGDEPIGSSTITGISWTSRRGTTGSMIGEERHRGQGYGGEAMRLRTRYAFQELGLEKLTSWARADNARSIRGLMRAGYREVGIQRRHKFSQGRWHDSWLGEVLREDWLEANQ